MLDKILSLLTPEKKKAIQDQYRIEENKPLVVSIMGQTGVGKSSLINSLFNVSFETHDFKPCTKEPEKHILRTDDGFELWFWDMPGIGESSEADSEYIEMYKAKIRDSDVLIWAVHSDSRSVTFEVDSLWRLVRSMPEDERGNFISKTAFILTKADTVVLDPWIAQVDGKNAIFAPSAKTQELLESKADYFAEKLMSPFNEYLILRTFIKDPAETDGIEPEIGNLRLGRRSVSYKGRLTRQDHDTLKERYPNLSGILARLLKNSGVAYCSSRIRFNLPKVMTMIADRIEGPASARFKHFVSKANMNLVSVDRVKSFSNLIIIDKSSTDILFDVSGVKIRVKKKN